MAASAAAAGPANQQAKAAPARPGVATRAAAATLDFLLATVLRRSRPALAQLAVDAAERASGTWLTSHARPVRADAVGTASDPVRAPNSVGVVLQGALAAADDFTLDTVRIYRRHFPEATIIVSTWEGQDAALVARLRDAGAEVLLNPKPAYAGISNVNLQLASAAAGVRRSAELGMRYTMKSRTDQRCYAPNALQFLCEMVNAFPVRPGFAQAGRVVVPSLDTFKYRLYGASDQLTFGLTGDMVAYWSAPPDPRRAEDVPQTRTWGEYAKLNIVEAYIVTEYLRRVGRPVAWTLRDSWQAFADHFCVVDDEALDLFWPKYERRAEHRLLTYDAVRVQQPLGFRDWLLMYAGRFDLERAPEHVLDLPYDGRVY